MDTITKTKLSAKTKTIIALAILGAAGLVFAGFTHYKYKPDYKEIKKNFGSKEKLLGAKKATETPKATPQSTPVASYKNNKILDIDVLVNSSAYAENYIKKDDVEKVFEKANYLLGLHTNIKAALRNFNYIPITPATASNYFNNISSKDLLPEAIVIYTPKTAGAFSLFKKDLGQYFPGFCNEFRSPEKFYSSASFVPAAQITWDNKYYSCGYSNGDPESNEHISNQAIGPECNEEKVPCILNKEDQYYICDKEFASYSSAEDLKTGKVQWTSIKELPGADLFLQRAALLVHEILHAYGGIYGSSDHSNSPQCQQACKKLQDEGKLNYEICCGPHDQNSVGYYDWLKNSQLYADMCPVVWYQFANSWQECP